MTCLAVVAVLVALSAPAAADPPTLVCRQATPVDTEGPACEATSVVMRPCAGLLVPGADIINGHQAEADLVTCRAHRASETKTHAEQLAAVEQALAAARALEEQQAAELDRVRGQIEPDGVSWWAVVAVGGVGVAVGLLVGGLAL